MFRRGGGGKRRDAIEPAVIQALRACGVETWQIGGTGLPDLLTRYKGVYGVLELKSGKAGRLTKHQGDFPVARSVEEALRLTGLREIADWRAIVHGT